MNTLEAYQKELDGMHAADDIPGDWTPRQHEEYETRRRNLVATIGRIQTAQATLAEVAQPLSDTQTWHDHLEKWREESCQELIRVAQGKNPEARAAQQSATLSIRRVDRGLDLMREFLPGEIYLDGLMRRDGFVPATPFSRAQGDAWFGSMPECEARLRALQHRRDVAQRVLDAELQTDEDRAEVEAMRTTANSMHIKTDRTGTGLVVVDDEGDARDLATLTPEEAKAYEWFCRAQGFPVKNDEMTFRVTDAPSA
jgi:hypothetical protein